MNDRTDDEAQLVQAYRDMYRGMLDRDIELLDDLLADGYTLTHMTGYRQAGAEWLRQVGTGEMRYHTSQERSVSVEISGDAAVLVGQNLVDATTWGSRGTWSLQLTTHYEHHNGGWVALPWIVPIPGTRRTSRVAENADATTVALSADEVADLNETAARIGVVGNRYNDAGMAMVGL